MNQGDLFGMVCSCDPFKGCLWPPTRDQKGHFESPGKILTNIKQLQVYLLSIKNNLIQKVAHGPMVAPMSWSQYVFLSMFFCHILAGQEYQHSLLAGSSHSHPLFCLLGSGNLATSQLRMWHIRIYIYIYILIYIPTLKQNSNFAPENGGF